MIGIDASRAFVKNRTGIEEYSYQVIKHLRTEMENEQVILYLRWGDRKNIDFKIPKNWQVKELLKKYFWTQFGLSVELLVNPVDVLFVPAHTIPFIHPRRSVVTIHGLEYEFSPESYSLYSRIFHRFFIKKSCRWADKIIAVSDKTKQDLIKLYKTSADKIEIIPNGFNSVDVESVKKNKIIKNSVPYLFFIGRLEERKNVINIIKAFEILKNKYHYSGTLLLGGGKGHGYDKIKKVIKESPYKIDIHELGFVSEDEKWQYFKYADAFLFPSLLEGFGIPILEAQSMETPVVTSDLSPMKEVAGDKRIIVNPNEPLQIAEIVHKILQSKELREDIVRWGLENVRKYSWERTAKEIAGILKS